MRALPVEYSKNKMYYRMVLRNKTHAIYSLHEKENDKTPRGFEVIEIIHFKEDKHQKYGGQTIVFEKGEYLPGNNQWGKLGWSYYTFKDAFIKFKGISE